MLSHDPELIVFVFALSPSGNVQGDYVSIFPGTSCAPLASLKALFGDERFHHCLSGKNVMSGVCLYLQSMQVDLLLLLFLELCSSKHEMCMFVSAKCHLPSGFLEFVLVVSLLPPLAVSFSSFAVDARALRGFIAAVKKAIHGTPVYNLKIIKFRTLVRGLSAMCLGLIAVAPLLLSSGEHSWRSFPS